MKAIKILGLSLFALAALNSCSRKESDPVAGKGGNATLICVPKHHDVYKNLINTKIFIKYNTLDAPAAYDDSVSCSFVDGVPTATFSGLKTGNYYLLGTGYDTSISQDVKGGTSYVISSEATLNIVVPVTETH